MSQLIANAKFMIAMAAVARRKGNRAHAAYYLAAAAFERQLAFKFARKGFV